MAEPALPPDMREGPSKGGLGLDAPAFAANAAPTAGLGAEAPGAGGKEGPLPEPGAPLQAPEISGPAPSTPARAAPLTAAPPSPMGVRGVTAGEAAAAPASSRRSAAGRMPPIVYGGLAALMAATALILLLTPRLVAMGMFRKSASHPMDAQLTQLLQLHSGALLAGAGVAAALAAAAAGRWENGDPGTADLLRAGLAGQAGTGVALFIAYLSIVHPITWLAELATNGAAMMLPALDLASRRVDAQAIGRQLGRALVPRSSSLLAALHFLLSLLFPASGLLLAAAPWFTLYHFWGYSYGKAAFLLARLAGAADLFVVPIAQLALKSFAERGALGSPAARALNLGTLLAALIHTGVELRMMAGAPAGFLLPVNLSTWVFAGLTSAASLLAGGRPADLAAEMKEVAEGIKKKE